MRTSSKRIAIAVLCIAVLAICAACSGKEECPLLGNWEYYSVTIDGKTEYAAENTDPNMKPQFSTEDGENFKLSVKVDKVYKGTITKNSDGTYELHNGDNPNTLNASVVEDKLTITLPSGSNLVFVRK